MDLDTFFVAVQKGDVQTVRRGLEAGVDVNAKGDLIWHFITVDQTSLHVASACGQTEVAEPLIKNWADLEARNWLDRTSLHVASEYGQTEVAELLIKNGANLEAREGHNQTSLHVASQYGQTEVAELLIKNGADLEARDYEYQTSLHVASRYGQTEVAELLIKNGANLEGRNGFDRTSLHVASAWGQTEVAELLIKNGADLEARDEDQSTPLYKAAARGHTGTCELLIRSGADVTTKDKFQSTPLHEAAAGGHTRTCELLIRSGADVTTKNEDQSTPLHEAAARGHDGTCELLIRSGADVMTKDEDQSTPLHKAAAGGHDGTCELLIRSGADVMTKDEYQDTPLHKAAAGGHDETCELLIRSGADVNTAIDRDQDTLLHLAAARGDTKTCELLISLGAGVMVQNKDHDTPLHKAAAVCHTGICELLIRSGTDVMVKNKDGKAPLDYQRDPETRRHWKNLDKQVKQERSYHQLMQQSGGVRVNRFKVFVGGKEATGKSTLKQSLTKGLLSALIQRLSRRPVTQPHDPTPGVDIGTFHVPGVGEVSVWDFAGQAEYAVTHNMFMDAENTVFVVLYNIMDDKKAQEQQVTWWLCFIKSCNPNRQPDVILVASNADQVDAAVGQDRAALVVQTMQTEFKDHLRISDEVILMDCRKTVTPEMDRLKSLLVRIGAALIQDQRDMPKLCAKVMKRLPKWCKSKTSTKCPVMMWSDYVKEVKKLDRLVTEDFLKKSSRFLHHLAELLFITPATCDPIIVLKPNWLGTDIFGRVMAPDYFENHLNRTSEDYVTREELQRVFQDVADVDLVITLLQEFQLCHTFDEETYIIPGLLTQKMPDEVWQPPAEPKVLYFGKQVQCADSTDMFSSAFFPQVQTCLMRELENRPSLWRDGATCAGKNVEGLIKLSPDGRAVNICVRSVQGDKVQCGKMLQQLENIIADVLDECSPGTGTVENVLSARALKEHREEFYCYGKEEISKAAVKDGTIVHPVLQFTEQINDLLCSEDGDPDTEGTKVFQPLPCEVDPYEQDIMSSQPADELQDKERPTTRTFPKLVQALAQQNTEETKVFHAVQSGVDSTEEDLAMPAQMTGEHQNKKEPLNKNSPQRILQDTVETKVFKAVQDEADPLSADMLMATLSINQPQDKLMPTQQTDELQQGEDTITDQLNRNRPELVKALIYKVEQILDHLLSRNILSVEECAIIKANRVRQEKARTLLEIVVTKGEGACGVFLDVLKEVCPHAAEIVQGGSSNLPCSEDDDPIKKNRPELVLALRDVEPVMDRLLACDILSGEECNRIRAKETPEDKARELLDIIETKDKGARDMFKEVLEEINPELLM